LNEEYALNIRRKNGDICQQRSKTSMPLCNSPRLSITAFSMRCGCGKKGARPRRIHARITNDQGILLMNVSMRDVKSCKLF